MDYAQLTEPQLEEALRVSQQKKEAAKQECRAITQALDKHRALQSAVKKLDAMTTAERNAIAQVQTLRMSGKPQSV